MQIMSQHKSKTAYHVFILLDLEASGLERVAEWCCRCNSGLRTVNPCGHVIAVLGILCYGIDGPTPAQHLENLFIHELHDESDVK